MYEPHVVSIVTSFPCLSHQSVYTLLLCLLVLLNLGYTEMEHIVGGKQNGSKCYWLKNNIKLFHLHPVTYLIIKKKKQHQYVNGYSITVIFYFLFFSVRLLSVLRDHSFFSSPPQRPMTSDFEGFLYQILSITLFSYLNSWERASISLFNVEC